MRTIAAYSVLNSRPEVQARWGLNRETIDRLRHLLVGGGAEAAQDLVPRAALDDLILPDADPRTVGEQARALGVSSMAIPAFSLEEVGDRFSRRLIGIISHMRVRGIEAFYQLLHRIMSCKIR